VQPSDVEKAAPAVAGSVLQDRLGSAINEEVNKRTSRSWQAAEAKFASLLRQFKVVRLMRRGRL
jgi:hypothetical protein